jgi:hypothetical protein
VGGWGVLKEEEKFVMERNVRLVLGSGLLCPVGCGVALSGTVSLSDTCDSSDSIAGSESGSSPNTLCGSGALLVKATRIF